MIFVSSINNIYYFTAFLKWYEHCKDYFETILNHVAHGWDNVYNVYAINMTCV